MKLNVFLVFVFLLISVTNFAEEKTLPDDAPIETPIEKSFDGAPTSSGDMFGPPPPPPASLESNFPTVILCVLIIGNAFYSYNSRERKV